MHGAVENAQLKSLYLEMDGVTRGAGAGEPEGGGTCWWGGGICFSERPEEAKSGADNTPGGWGEPFWLCEGPSLQWETCAADGSSAGLSGERLGSRLKAPRGSGTSSSPQVGEMGALGTERLWEGSMLSVFSAIS